MADAGKQMRFTDDELALIKSTFQDNEKLLKVLRKVFLPEYDPNAPLGQAFDLWMTIDVKTVPPDRALINVQARNEVITHIEQQLLQLQYLAAMSASSPELDAQKAEQNSTK